MSLFGGVGFGKTIGIVGLLGGLLSIPFVTRKNEKVKKWYYLLADWGGQGIQWIVKSDKFSRPEEWKNKQLGFDDVTMYLGNKLLEESHEFTTQLQDRKYVLFKRAGRGGISYKLENGQELISSQLRGQWNGLKVTKYDEAPLKTWQKSGSAIDYDIKFRTCKFTQVNGSEADNKSLKIRVTCQIGNTRSIQTISKELTQNDYKLA